MTARRLARKALAPLVIAAASSLLLLTVTGGTAGAQEQDLVVEGTQALTWEPAELQIEPGDAVTFEVTGSPPHPVTPGDGADFDASACGLDAMSAVGDSCEITFEEAGTYPYVCTVHEAVGMVGTITVGDGGGGEGGGGEAPAPTGPVETTTTVLDTPVAATTEEGSSYIYRAGWGLLVIGAVIALVVVVGYLRFAPAWRSGNK